MRPEFGGQRRVDHGWRRRRVGDLRGWFGLTRSRFALLLMTLLMLAISGCALLAAFILSSFLLLPVGVIQILAILLLESRESRFWMEGAPIMNTGNRHHA